MSETTLPSIGHLKPYPEYKDSGQAWIGQVPEHWEILPNRILFSEIKDRGHSDEEMLSVTIKKGVIQQRTLLANSSKKDSSNINRSVYKLVQPNDLAYNKMRAWQGSFGVSNYRGIVSPAYIVIRPRNKSAQSIYYHYLYRTPSFTKEAERWSYGITSDMWSLRPEDFKMIYAPVPSPTEQASIAKYLDHITRSIDAAIRAKRKIIALIEEQKRAIIQLAVTRGLDPNVKLKDSGVPWIGEIPEGWDIVRNMSLFAPRVEAGITGLSVLQVSLHSGVTRAEKDQFGREKTYIADLKKYKLIRRGDIAYNTMRMWQGAVGVSPSDGLVSPAYVVLKPREKTNPEFYNFIFHADFYKQQVNRESTGIVSDRNRLYWDSFKQMLNLSLPSDEQEKIVTYIKSKIGNISSEIERTDREMFLLREYRTRLVSDVVTGKLDVREAAARLPEVVESSDSVPDVLDSEEEIDETDGE